MNKPIISINNLHISYNENVILKNINLNINKGDFIYFIGETGSGKSSLLKSLLVGTKLTGDVYKTGSLINKLVELFFISPPINLFIPTQIKIKTGMPVQLNLFFLIGGGVFDLSSSP